MIGRTISHYRILSELGSGGMGVVYEAEAFQELSRNRRKLGISPMIGVVYVMLGRAHAGADRTAEARKAYEEAFTIWKAADPDLPLLVEARREYERLKT